jgi:ribosomal protein L11 methylase PrmA
LHLVQKTTWQYPVTRWSAYDELTSYSIQSFSIKKQIIEQLLSTTKPETVLDVGSNTGTFSFIASKYAKHVISCDIDPVAVNQQYLHIKEKHSTNISLMLQDITNPSPGIGWKNEERTPWLQRVPCHTVLALAILHHLVITHNLSFSHISMMLSLICKTLIIEFIPKSDNQILSLLHIRKDIFSWYSEDFFVKEFSKHFHIVKKIPIQQSGRSIFIMKKRAT